VTPTVEEFLYISPVRVDAFRQPVVVEREFVILPKLTHDLEIDTLHSVIHILHVLI
jgi:hypothetical protein